MLVKAGNMDVRVCWADDVRSDLDSALMIHAEWRSSSRTLHQEAHPRRDEHGSANDVDITQRAPNVAMDMLETKSVDFDKPHIPSPRP